ncbi:hypothetical protein BG015_000387 [Linnemannia schmuckeri]|uniref:Uncharacterized protein n=1 Tax=Linnemannia schmuckeri TaxID=64567 RepID=A0A9P5S7P2_9FUNG|nr:hypothetical protein BG015_000387 [Linnemannia schmuckeri]
MSPISGQANDTSLNGQRPNYGSLTQLNQPAAVRTRAGPNINANANAPSPASSLKSKQRQKDGAGTGTGVGAATGAGARNTATSHRSVQITVPDHVDEHGNVHSNNHDENEDDTSSISSRSSYSTYSSSTGSLNGLDHHNHKGSSYGENGEEIEEEVSSRRMFWTYVALTPVLLSILVLFAVLLQFLPSSTESGEYILHWDRFGEGAIGWTIAFAARTPLFAFFSKTLSDHNPHHPHNLQEDLYLCEWSTLLSAGALEETIRLLTILVLGIREDFGAVYWLGLGWTGVETLYYIGQSLVYTRWLAPDDEYRVVAGGVSGREASTIIAAAPTVTTSLLASTAGPSTSTSNSETPTTLETGYVNGRGSHSSSHLKILHNDIEEDEELVPTREARHLLGLDRPWWSLMGRTSSMMVHIGLCCWLGHSGWRLLLPAAAVHGSLYVIWGVLMPEQWSVPATSYGTWIAALGVFLIGLALYGEIV